jgi:hypothetical protein
MKLDLGAIMKGSGFDISLDAEYALLDSFLDVGTTITHIPLSAAVLNHSMAISADFEIEGDNILHP